MAGPVCWGIELGAGAVKALKLERDGENLNVLEYAVIPHKRVLSTPELDQQEATRLALGTLVSQYDLSGAPIAVSVPGHSAFARFAKLPPVEPKKIPDIVKFEAVQQIPFPIDDVEWDYQTFQSPDSPDVEVGIFAVTRQRVMERMALWADVGITPEFLTIGPVAVYNAMAWDLQFTENTPGTVIVDVGTTSTDLIIAEAGRVWIRTFQIGGHNFTEALVNTFKLSYPKAEKLKREAEQSKHARHVFQAMRPVFGDLAQDVQRSIGYYQSLHREANLTRMVVFGSTFNLPGLRKYLGQQLQMEVVRLERFKRLNIDGPAAAGFGAASLNMATAYGLALQGLGLPTIDANLIPKPVVREAMWQKKTKWFVAAAGLALAAGGASLIQPLLIDTQLKANPPARVIEDAKRLLNTTRSEWTEVESKFTPDYRAANALLVLDDRELYAHIANDVGQILKGAADKDEGKGFQFKQLLTEYIPPAGQSDLYDPYAQPGVPGEDTGAAGSQRTIQVTLEVSTTRGDATPFVRDTIQAWLYANGEREGVPYRIENVDWDLPVTHKVPMPGEEAMPTPAGGTSPRSQWGERGTPTSPRQSPGLATPGSGGHGHAPPPPRPGQRPGVPTGGGQAPAAPTELTSLAPLPEMPGEGEPGETVSTFTITWDAVIIEDQPAETQS